MRKMPQEPDKNTIFIRLGLWVGMTGSKVSWNDRLWIFLDSSRRHTTRWTARGSPAGFLPASVVPLDIDEFRDSVVLGRFNVDSWLAPDEAPGGLEGLKERTISPWRSSFLCGLNRIALQRSAAETYYCRTSPAGSAGGRRWGRWRTHSLQCLGEVVLW